MNNLAIALVDCDSFFASCEQLMNPSLNGKPVCVLSNNDGCVVARSKEAKALGITMGMPAFMARKQFPQAVYLSGRLGLYGEISSRVMTVLSDFSPMVEVYSIDEAFVDLGGLRRLYRKNYIEIAADIRNTVRKKVGVPVSVGVSINKTLVKLATERAKAGSGVYQIGSTTISNELKKTDLIDVWGIGRNTAAYLSKFGIHTAYEFVLQDDVWIKKSLGKRGLELKLELMGNCLYKLSNIPALPKSIQKTSSFGQFTNDEQYIKNSLHYHVHRACKKLRKLGMKAQMAEVMLRTKDFRVYSVKQVLTNPTDWEFDIFEAASRALPQIYDKNILYRSSGITLMNLTNSSRQQLSLFNDTEQQLKADRLAKCWDKLESRFGGGIISTF